MATISMSLPKFCTAARNTLRPMRPKPLMPTLIAISTPGAGEGRTGEGRGGPRPGKPGILEEPSPTATVMPRLPHALAPLALLVGALVAAPQAQAWSALGHRMVGELAQRHVQPATQAQIDALL